MKSCNNLCNVRSFECVLNFVRFVISDKNLSIQLSMLRMLAKYAARSCLLLAPWILPTCTLITGGEVAFKCPKLSIMEVIANNSDIEEANNEDCEYTSMES